MIIEVNGVSLHVEDHGKGTPVLLIHGWPDSAHLWRHQIPFLTEHGFRAIAPVSPAAIDMPGLAVTPGGRRLVSASPAMPGTPR